MNGTTVGSYRIVDTLSVGGMGTVYRAEHTLIGRSAAVKILHPELCANRDIVGRFFNEAKTTTSIKHPGIVEVFDFGYMESGHAYLIMELLEGAPLSHRMRARGPVAEGEAAAVLRGVCVALAAAHDKGVVHRDLKPDNIFVVPDPDSTLGARTKILDFGIAKLTDIGLAGTATKTGAVMGTPTYMSPEQCRGTGDVDFRADLYSIGCIFYELVTGRPPFVNSGAGELIGSHLFVEPDPPSRHIAGLLPDTEALIMSLLAKQPERRVQSAKELAHILAGIAQRHGWIAVGELSHPSLSHVVVGRPTPAAHLGTPVFTPAGAATPAATLLGSPMSPVGSPPSLPPATLVTDKPTTLSGAASQTSPPPRARRRSGLFAGVAIAAGAAVAVVAITRPGSSTAEHAATQPAPPPAAAPREPTTTTPSPPPATPTPAPAVEATPPSPAPLPSTAMAPTAPAIPSSPTAVPTPTAPAPSTATTSPPASPETPVLHTNPAASPRPSTTRPSKPSRKPVKKTEEPRDLLEKDI